MNGKIIIAGASARAAAFSAQRSGFEPYTVDLFADSDLVRFFSATRVANYPYGIAEAIGELPSGPWMYTGALENHPDLIDEITRQRPLYGNAGKQIRQVRNPRRMSEVFRDADLLYPDIVNHLDQIPHRPGWLRKPLQSAAGRHIEPLQQYHRENKKFYYQRQIQGWPCSAVYLVSCTTARLLGVTYQLTGCDWAGAAAFFYAGSIGPVQLERKIRKQFERIGETLRSVFDVRGLIGVDAVIANNQVWTVEINPRYTASVEILERAGRTDLISQHASAFGLHCDVTPCRADTSMMHGKAVCYAEKPLLITRPFLDWVQTINLEHRTWPQLADIPKVGSSIGKGQPVLTVFTSGTDLEQVENQLQLKMVALKQQLNK